MKSYPFIIFALLASIISCRDKQMGKNAPKKIETSDTQELEKYSFIYNDTYIATAFDYPVGKPDAQGYYNAQKFGKNYHLGDDWNAVTGGNSDLGDPIYAIADGYVKFAEDFKGGWGNVIRIIHKLPDGSSVESLYAHCDTIIIKEKDWIRRGRQIGTIGTAHGKYLAHLHFEIREDITLDIGGGYSEDTSGYLDPTKFIIKH